MSQLTGKLNTGQLRRVSKHGAVTVTVVRRIRAEDAVFFAEWSERVVAVLKAFDGCLGAAALTTAKRDEVHMVFRFTDAIALRSWERSESRGALLAEIDGLVEEERVTTVAGDEAYLASLAAVKPSRPLLVRVIIDAAWIFPIAFIWSTTLAPRFAELPLAARTLVSAGVITLIAEIVLVPARRTLRSRRGLPIDTPRRFYT